MSLQCTGVLVFFTSFETLEGQSSKVWTDQCSKGTPKGVSKGSGEGLVSLSRPYRILGP